MEIDFKALSQPGLYWHVGEGRRILYIGSTKNFLTRQGQHSGVGDTYWGPKIVSVRFEPMPYADALRMEIAAIKRFQPPYNTVHNPAKRNQSPRNRLPQISRELGTRQCLYCSREFLAKRHDHVYCALSCRGSDWGEKNGRVKPSEERRQRLPLPALSRAKNATASERVMS
jgi:hypothetical protein